MFLNQFDITNIPNNTAFNLRWHQHIIHTLNLLPLHQSMHSLTLPHPRKYIQSLILTLMHHILNHTPHIHIIWLHPLTRWQLLSYT
jgi:hypothetical protein